MRVEPHGNVTVLADHYDDRRLNSPNDLVYRSDGTLLFTDPPFGLPGEFGDPDKELPFSGVFAVRDGHVTLVTDELEGSSGLAFSPDERYLYVGNWDPERKVVMRYELGSDDQAIAPQVLFDMTDAEGEDAIDGIKVDRAGMSTPAGPAASGSSRPPANISELSACPSRRTTSPGETMTAGRSTSPRSRACTASDSRYEASDPDRRTPR